jgi:choloylglycine hydrolase
MRKTSLRRGILAPTLLAIALSTGPAAIFHAEPVEACSRILWHNKLGTYVARSEDWFEDAPTNLWVLPRGAARVGAVADNPYKWTSKHGSLIVSMYDHIAMSGMNERGLAAHMLWLEDTKVAPRDPKLPAISISQWLQWYLDSFATVKEAVEATRNLPFQIRMGVDDHGNMGLVHIAIEDAGGDSAIFEIIEGAMKIHHDRRHIVMTNEPTFDKQLAILKEYSGFGGTKPLPGTLDATDRFVRGAFYAKNLPEPKDERNAVAALLSVIRNVGFPFGMPSPERAATHTEASPTVSFTIFRLILNLNQRVVYFDRVFSPTVFWVRMDGLDFSESAAVKKLVTVGNNLAYDATAKFQPAEMFKFVPSTEKTLGGRRS